MLNLVWNYSSHNKPYVLHSENKEDMADDTYVIFQIWKNQDSRENVIGILKDIFVHYFDSLKIDGGPFYFVYSKISKEASKQINIEDIPNF